MRGDGALLLAWGQASSGVHTTNTTPALLQQMGVQALVSFQLHMRMNGQYFGKYCYTEQMDEASLKVR